MVFTGRLNPWVGGKDIVLELLRRWGAKQSQGMSVEFVDRDRQLPMVSRNTIANMMAEAEALNGIFAPDDVTREWYRAKGITEFPYPFPQAGKNAIYEIDETFALGDVAPMIAKPFSPGNAFPAEEVARERITFDKAMIGSCTNGSYDDLLQAALVIREAGKRGLTKAVTEFKVFPGSGGVARLIERPDQRLGGESIAERLPRGRRGDSPVLVRTVFRSGAGSADAGPARDYDLQSQLAEPHGPRRRRVPRQPRRGRRVRARRLHGAAERAGTRVETGNLRRVDLHGRGQSLNFDLRTSNLNRDLNG